LQTAFSFAIIFCAIQFNVFANKIDLGSCNRLGKELEMNAISKVGILSISLPIEQAGRSKFLSDVECAFLPIIERRRRRRVLDFGMESQNISLAYATFIALLLLLLLLLLIDSLTSMPTK